jgi:transposase
MEQLVMNRKERQRLAVLSRVKDKQWSRRQGAEILGLSLRQMHRIFGRYLAEGDAGLIHRSRGRPSRRRIDAQEREKGLALYRSRYRSFGPTLLAEKLGKDHGIWVSHDTTRWWLISEGLLEKPRRGRRSRQRRPRRERFGQMVQMDGSHHAWFDERAERCCLMDFGELSRAVMIDDATGRMQGRFFPAETLAAALEMTRRWCQRFGIPQSLYVDRHGIYRCDREPTAEELRRKRSPVTQFGRAMKELDVRLILAHSPQAKGRVERANGTLQDRLVKELRLAGIDSVASANAWLEHSGFFEELNEKFAVVAIEPVDAHRPAVMRLDDVLCVKEKRSVSHDGCVQWQGRTLQLRGQRTGLRQVEVWQQLDGTLRLLDGGGSLSYGPWTAPPKARPVIKNNKVYKPGRHQQLKLPGSPPWPKSESKPGLRKTG